MVGETVGQYKILEPLGEGGMGVVFRAQDTRLQRQAALKFLAGAALTSDESKERFLHEARAAAALDHPNICGVYEINEDAGRLYMAMPLLEGRSLDKRISEGPRPLPEILAVLLQTAEALEEAHAKGIVHRDIKPANIMVNERGRGRLHCVLMDFGLARLSQATKLTREGSQLGTAAYMSPEQTQGSEVDARTDIWSLGVVGYEMTAGVPPFNAAYEQALFYGILTEDPEPLTAQRTGVPMELERIIAKSMAKSPDERYQNATDLLVDLHALDKTLSAESRTATRSAVQPHPVQSSIGQASIVQASAGRSAAMRPGSAAEQAASPVPDPAREAAVGAASKIGIPQAVGLALALAAVAAALVWALKPTTPSATPADPSRTPQYALRRITWDGALAGFPALSPDGSLIAYSSDRAGAGDLDIWVQQVEGGSAIRVTSDPADDLQPSFSPDGSRLVYHRSGGGVYLVPTFGGDPYLVQEGASHASFAPDGDHVAYLKSGRAYQSPVSMGEPAELFQGFEFVGPPLWTPDGSHVLAYGRRPGELADWWAVGAAGGQPVPLGAARVFERIGLDLPAPEAWSWSGDGPVLGVGGALYRVPLDPTDWTAGSPPERLTFGSGVEALPSASASGRIAFMSVRQRRDIWSLPLDGSGEPQRLTRDESSDTAVDLTPDGRRMVYLSNRWGRSDIWTRDLTTGKDANLTDDAAQQRCPVLSPDGERVAYYALEDGKAVIYVRPFTGGVGRPLCGDCGIPRDWSPDGKYITYDRGERSVVHVLDVAGGRTAPILAPEDGEASRADFSPDGDWLAFRLSGQRAGLRLAPFRGLEPAPASDWIAVSDGADDSDPAWSPSGDALYFTTRAGAAGAVRMQRLAAADKRPVGPPVSVRLFPTVRRSLDMMMASDRSLAVSADRLVFPLSELAGDVWLMEPD